MTSDSPFDPFNNEAQVLHIGRLMIENRLDRVSFSGDVDLTLDQPGLARARELHALLGKVVGALEKRQLPEALPAPAVTTVPNPFAD